MSSIKKFSLKGGMYRPLRISKENTKLCWEDDFQETLHELAGDVFPHAEYVLVGDDPHVVYTNVGDCGRNSFLFALRGTPSKRDIKRLEQVIDNLKERANDVSIPYDKQVFLKNFRLPNPRVMPECWVVAPGFLGLFSHKTYVLWGLEKVGVEDATFFSADSSNVLRDLNKKNRWWRKLLHILGVALIIALCVLLLRSCVGGCTPKSTVRENVTSISNGWHKDNIDSKLGAESEIKTSDTGGGVSGNSGGESSSIVSGGSVSSSVSGDSASSSGISSILGGTGGGFNTTGGSREGSGFIVIDSNSGANGISAMRHYSFKITRLDDISKETGDVAYPKFGVSSITPINIDKVKFVVSDWQVNDDKVQHNGDTFSPNGGLRYDRSYTITASVFIDGIAQSVEPFQWNLVDSPAWQIFEIERKKADDGGMMRQYRLRCCNSSLVEPKVESWDVSFSKLSYEKEETLNFPTKSMIVDNQTLAVSKDLGYFEGEYFMILRAKINYAFRSRKEESTHLQQFPFSHDSTGEGLTRAKYESVIPMVYFCLAKTSSGNMLNGTAFAITKKYLLTNYHVAVGGIPESYSDKSNYKVSGLLLLTNAKGLKFTAKVVASDRGRDLALLRICDEKGEDVTDELPHYLNLATDEEIDVIKNKTSRNVFAIGYPEGTVMLGLPAFTDGKADRVFKRSYSNGAKYETIANFTSIEQGYSGGPLIDYNAGVVLGVNFGGMCEIGEEYKGACFATSAREVREAFKEYMAK